MKATKNQNKNFIKRVEEILLQNGFKQVDNYYLFVYNSPVVGEIKMHPSKDNDYIFSIFGVFKEPSKAVTYFNCNDWSGKYNIHSKVFIDALDDLNDFLINLKQIENKLK